MKLDLQLATEVLDYACFRNFNNTAFSILCKYFDTKEKFDTLPKCCKERIYSHTLYWIVKYSKFALFQECLMLLRLLQTAHPDLCPSKDWAKLKLGIKVKIVLQQMLSGSSTSRCLETFQSLFPDNIEARSASEKSLPSLLHQLIQHPSERNLIHTDAICQYEVGPELIHTIKHRVRHLVRNVKRKLPSPELEKVQRFASLSCETSYICWDNFSRKKQEVYKLSKEGKLTMRQIEMHLQLDTAIDETKLSQTIRRLFDNLPVGAKLDDCRKAKQFKVKHKAMNTARAGGVQPSSFYSRKRAKLPEERPPVGWTKQNPPRIIGGSKESDVSFTYTTIVDEAVCSLADVHAGRSSSYSHSDHTDRKRHRKKHKSTTKSGGIGSANSSAKDNKNKENRRRSGKERQRAPKTSPTNEERSSMEDVGSSRVDAASEDDLKLACRDSKVMVVLNKMTLPVARIANMEESGNGSLMLSSGPLPMLNSKRSPMYWTKMSPALSTEMSPVLSTARSPPLSSEASPVLSSDCSSVDNEERLLDLLDVPKDDVESLMPRELGGNTKRKHQIQTSQQRSKVRSRSVSSSDSAEYFCKATGNAEQEIEPTNIKENSPSMQRFFKKVGSTLDKSSTGVKDYGKIGHLKGVSDSTTNRQICREIETVSLPSSEECGGRILSELSRGSHSSRESSEELLVVGSFYSQSIERLKNYKWNSKESRIPNTRSSSSLSGLRQGGLTVSHGVDDLIRLKKTKGVMHNGCPSLSEKMAGCTSREKTYSTGKTRKAQRLFDGCDTEKDANFSSPVGSCDGLDQFLDEAGQVLQGQSLTCSPVFEFKYSSSGSSSNRSISLLTGKRVLFSAETEPTLAVPFSSGASQSLIDLSPILLTQQTLKENFEMDSSGLQNSGDSSKSGVSSTSVRVILETDPSEEIENSWCPGAASPSRTPAASNRSIRKDNVSSSSSELQLAQRWQTLSCSESNDDVESIPDSDEESRDWGRSRFPSLTQYLKNFKDGPALQPCRVQLDQIKLEQMRLRVLLSQEETDTASGGDD